MKQLTKIALCGALIISPLLQASAEKEAPAAAAVMGVEVGIPTQSPNKDLIQIYHDGGPRGSLAFKELNGRMVKINGHMHYIGDLIRANNIDSAKVFNIDADGLAVLGALTNLKEIGIEHYSHAEAALAKPRYWPDDLKMLKDLNKLQRLTIMHYPFGGDELAEALVDMPLPESLEVLQLDNCAVTAKGKEFLKKFLKRKAPIKAGFFIDKD